MGRPKKVKPEMVIVKAPASRFIEPLEPVTLRRWVFATNLSLSSGNFKAGDNIPDLTADEKNELKQKGYIKEIE